MRGLRTAWVWPGVVVIAVVRSGAAEQVTIHRDQWGVPHIFAKTEEGACFGAGYAQAEDRLEQMMQNYRLACGTMSEVFGPRMFEHDLRQRRWRHATISRKLYRTLSAKTRACMEAFQKGVEKYMADHPTEVPPWAPKLEPWMQVALSRMMLWVWPMGEAADDLSKVGIELPPGPHRGSTESLSPGNPPPGVPRGTLLALIDPHMEWYGPTRFHEARMYGGDLQLSGAFIVGGPLPILGHNAHLSVAMTTGGPDTTDVYVETLNPRNPKLYKYDGQWQDMTIRTVQIRVREGQDVKTRQVQIPYTRHGPVVTTKDGKAYAVATSYAHEVRLIDQLYAMMTARDVTEMKHALSMAQLMSMNVMVGTVTRDMYYQRTGRVPIRPKGIDHTRPIPGHLSQNQWRGIHATKDLVSCLNPKDRYMVNSNSVPAMMMANSPMKPEDYPSYIYNDLAWQKRQRQHNALKLFDAHRHLKLEVAKRLAFDTSVYNAERWQANLARAWQRADRRVKANPNVAQMYKAISSWNRRCDADQTGVLAYKFWKESIPEKLRGDDRTGDPPRRGLKPSAMIEALATGARRLAAAHGSVQVKFGDVYRIGREGGKHFPASGGDLPGLSTLRTLYFGEARNGKFYAYGGQCAVMLVLLTNPIQSWSVTPLGQSDHKRSPHWEDQMAELFSKQKMKDTYFKNTRELMKHVKKTTKLAFGR